jgi:hypothetical protein
MLRVDDPDLGDQDVLWRRVLPEWITSDEGTVYRPSSMTFMDRHANEVSVSVANLTDVATMLNGHPNDSLVAFKAGNVRKAGGIVGLTPENPDLAHRVLVYPNPSRMRSAAKLLTDSNVFSWVVLKPPMN